MDPELRRRVKVVAAARDQSVKDWIEGVIREALVRELQGARGDAPGETATGEDRAWLDNDLSSLGGFEPYDWEEGELEEGQPVSYEPGIGIVVEDGKRHDGRQRGVRRTSGGQGRHLCPVPDASARRARKKGTGRPWSSGCPSLLGLRALGF